MASIPDPFGHKTSKVMLDARQRVELVRLLKTSCGLTDLKIALHVLQPRRSLSRSFCQPLQVRKEFGKTVPRSKLCNVGFYLGELKVHLTAACIDETFV